MSNKSNITSRGIISGYNRVPGQKEYTLEEYKDIILNLDSYWRWYDFTDYSSALIQSSVYVSRFYEQSGVDDYRVDAYVLSGLAGSNPDYFSYATGSDSKYFATPQGGPPIDPNNRRRMQSTGNTIGITGPTNIVLLSIIKGLLDTTYGGTLASIANSTFTSASRFLSINTTSYNPFRATPGDYLYQYPYREANLDEYVLTITNNTADDNWYIEIGGDWAGVGSAPSHSEYYEFIFLADPSLEDIKQVIAYYELKYGL